MPKKAQFIILIGVFLSLCFAFDVWALNDGAGNEFLSSNVGIKTRSPTSTLDVNGSITTNGFKLTASPGLNKVLTSDASGNGSWANSSGSGTKILLSTQTASNSTEITFTNIDATYDKYVIEMYNVKASLVAGLIIRISTDNGSTYKSGASDYTWAFNFIDSGAAPTLESDVDDSEIELIYSNNSLRSMTDLNIGSLEGELCLITPAITNTHHRFRWNIGYGIEAFDPDSRTAQVSGSGAYKSTNAYDAIKFYLSNSAVMKTGTFKLYGLL